MIGRVLYVILALLIIGGYAWAEMRGMGIPRAQQGFAPKGRGTHGGPGVFWYGGYRGGK